MLLAILLKLLPPDLAVLPTHCQANQMDNFTATSPLDAPSSIDDRLPLINPTPSPGRPVDLTQLVEPAHMKSVFDDAYTNALSKFANRLAESRIRPASHSAEKQPKTKKTSPRSTNETKIKKLKKTKKHLEDPDQGVGGLDGAEDDEMFVARLLAGATVKQ